MVIHEVRLTLAQHLGAGILRRGPVIQDHRVPPGRGGKEILTTLFAEDLKIALHHDVEVTQQDGAFTIGRAVLVRRDRVDGDMACILGLVGDALGHVHPVIARFAFVQRGPVGAGHGGDQTVDLDPVHRFGGQEGHVADRRVPPDPPPARQPRGVMTVVDMGRRVHEAAIAKEKRISAHIFSFC